MISDCFYFFIFLFKGYNPSKIASKNRVEITL